MQGNRLYGVQNTGNKNIMFLFSAIYIAITVVVVYPKTKDKADPAFIFLCKFLKSE